MELTGNTDPEAVRVYQSPTTEEVQSMQLGRCILLKQYIGIVPMSIAQTRPDRGELYGYLDGQLKGMEFVPYPKIITGSLADKVYFHRIEAAADRIVSVLSDL